MSYALSFWKANGMDGLSDFSVHWNPVSQCWELQIDYRGFLFSAIALQLALVVAEADSLYVCSGCSKPYTRDKRRPKPGSDNYCEMCEAGGVAKRRAVDRYREKKVEAARLFAGGMPVAEIAAKLGATEVQVQKWFTKGNHVAKRKTRS
jgi:hypothetical protein